MRRGITTLLEVDLSVLRNNFKVLQQYVKPAGLIAVLKGNAYGHGLVQVAKALQEAGCTRCAVATLDEALLLKKNMITLDIHLLGAISSAQMEIAIREDLIPFVAFPEALALAESIAVRMKKRSRVHIKIDSGMGRFGHMPSDMPKLISLIKVIRWISIEGIATHLARAKDDPEFSKIQFRAFEREVIAVEEAVGHHLLRHALATIGVLSYKDCVDYDLIRVGSLLYGLALMPIPTEVGVRTALSLKTQLVQVKQIPRGWNLGYGRAVADDNMKVGLIPAGIVDGFMSSSALEAQVLVRGLRCKVIGVSADSAIVDLTMVPNAEMGDEVVIIGSQGDAVVSAYELGMVSGTNYAEIIMKIMPRVPRIYMDNGVEVAEESML